MQRRRLLKNAALAGATVAAGRSFFFPKPVTAYSYNRYLSLSGDDGSTGRIYGNFISSGVAREIGASLPSELPQDVIDNVQSAQDKLTGKSFSEQQTPYAQRRQSLVNLLWGRQQQEELGVNAGFGTVQIVRNYAEPITFTGATTIGVDTGIQILGTDGNLNPLELDDLLLPTLIRTEDNGLWAEGGLATYDTRAGEVIRTYEVLNPGPGGKGLVTLRVTTADLGNYIFHIEVTFA